MTLALTVLQITAPVFLLAGIGFVWVRLGHAYDTAFVTRLAMTLAVPALILTALAGTDLDPAAVGRLALATLAAYAAALGLFHLLCRALRLEVRTYLAPLAFGNTGNLGLPLCLFAFGEAGLALGVVVFAVTAIGSFTLGLWIVAGGGSPLPALREPMVGATILGGIMLALGWELPAVAANALGLVGQMAIPLMLITLGVAVARLRPSGMGRVAGLAATKLVAMTAMGWGMARAFGLDDVAAGVLILQMATPVAVTSYLLAAKYGADAERVAGLVVVSTLMAIAALPALLTVLV
ncbi:AEC family transporter [Jannaschia sp. LMIT008]|uniref:AEC family transporter n=1 Tax=Jannaschia maritima TaxID=3032585 RepID=UPI002810E7A8|nr:AEC family transporter [Jannaschia sp. LMIT008]